MFAIRTGLLLCASCCIMPLLNQWPCQTTVESGTTAGHRVHPGAVVQLSHAQQTQACNHRQKIAQAVLEYVSKGPCSQPRSSAAGAPPRGLPSQVNSITTHLQLPHYIHHLPSGPAPAAWWHLCDTIHTQGLAGLQLSLGNHKKQLPDVQGAAAAHCQLGRHPWGYTFRSSSLSAFVASLFYSIAAGRAAAARQLKAPAPQLNRFDLFHGHMFIAYECRKGNNAVSRAKNDSRSTGSIFQQLHTQHSTINAGTKCENLYDAASMRNNSGSSTHGCQIGILFHAAEYPAFDETMFPVNLGHCQVNSSCSYNQRTMDLRNMLWWQGQLAVLDVGVDSPLHDLLLHDGTEPLRTLYEEDFGKPVADLLFLQPPCRRRRQLAAEQRRLQWIYGAVAARQGMRLPRTCITADEGQELPVPPVGIYVSY